jgi:hypothetical protein
VLGRETAFDWEPHTAKDRVRRTEPFPDPRGGGQSPAPGKRDELLFRNAAWAPPLTAKPDPLQGPSQGITCRSQVPAFVSRRSRISTASATSRFRFLNRARTGRSFPSSTGSNPASSGGEGNMRDYRAIMIGPGSSRCSHRLYCTTREVHKSGSRLDIQARHPQPRSATLPSSEGT